MFQTQFMVLKPSLKKEFLVTLFNLIKMNDWDCKLKNDEKANKMFSIQPYILW